MANPFNGSRRGKRGGRPDPNYEPPHKQSPTGTIPETAGVFFESFEGETKKDHLIPRRSLTERLHLRHFEQELEFEQLKDTTRIQLDKKGTPTTTTDPRYRLAWKSDKTLLRQGKPDTWGEKRGTLFTRIKSQSKERGIEIEIKPADGSTVSIGRTEPDPLEEI